MIDRDSLLRKMRKTKLENDITAYKMKRNEVNICLRKAKSKYYQNLLDENILNSVNDRPIYISQV